MKKVLILLCLLLSLGCLLCACGEEEYGFKYELNSDGASYELISCHPEPGERSVTVPETYEGKPVTAIGKRAFSGCGVVNINLPETVRSIGPLAFYNCSNLQELVLPSYLEEIGAAAFEGCVSLESVSLPAGLELVESSLFYGCTSLTSVVLPEGVNRIRPMAFSGCVSLSRVTIPSTVIGIEEGAFYQCSALQTVVLPKGLEEISASAFGNSGLVELTIPSGVSEIGTNAFRGCGNLANVTFDVCEVWHCAESANATESMTLLATKLANTEIAARYLRDTYASYYWYCAETHEDTPTNSRSGS